RDGWLNRYLATKGTCEECAKGGNGKSAGAREAGGKNGRSASLFRAVSMTQQTPRILMGPEASVAMNSIDEFAIRANGPAVASIEAMYAAGGADLVHAAGGEMLEAMKILRAANPAQYEPRNGAQYPQSPFGQHLKQIAQLIKADVGLEVAFADVGGWDT